MVIAAAASCSLPLAEVHLLALVLAVARVRAAVLAAVKRVAVGPHSRLAGSLWMPARHEAGCVVWRAGVRLQAH